MTILDEPSTHALWIHRVVADLTSGAMVRQFPVALLAAAKGQAGRELGAPASVSLGKRWSNP